MSIVADGVSHAESGTLVGQFTTLSIDNVFIAGAMRDVLRSISSPLIPWQLQQDFHGCLQTVSAMSILITSSTNIGEKLKLV